MDLWLYLWDLYSLWFQWGQVEGQPFSNVLSVDIQAAVHDVLATRLEASTEQKEIDALLKLAGYLFVAGLPYQPGAAAASIPDALYFETLEQRADSNTFVPAALHLFGLEAVFGDEGRVLPATWQRVLLKADEYADRRAALEYLCALVRARCAGYLTHPWAFAGRHRLTSRVILAFPGMGPPTVRK